MHTHTHFCMHTLSFGQNVDGVDNARSISLGAPRRRPTRWHTQTRNRLAGGMPRKTDPHPTLYIPILCMRTHMHMDTCIHTHAHTHMHMHAHLHICTHTHTFGDLEGWHVVVAGRQQSRSLRSERPRGEQSVPRFDAPMILTMIEPACMCMYLCVCVYVYVCVCMCVCMCVCTVCVCMHTHAHTYRMEEARNSEVRDMTNMKQCQHIDHQVQI